MPFVFGVIIIFRITRHSVVLLMSNEKTVRLDGLKEADQIVFTSLLSLLSFKTDSEWTIVEQGPYDIAIVDVDTDRGKLAATSLENQGKKVVCFGVNDFAKSHELRLNKPLRANDILKCLNNLTSPTMSSRTSPQPKHQDHDTHLVGVRLTRWPDREILASFPGSSKLCAVLMRHTISLEKASDVSGLPLESVERFVSMCKTKNCILERHLEINHQDTLDKKPRKHGLLFSKLRLKFESRA